MSSGIHIYNNNYTINSFQRFYFDFFKDMPTLTFFYEHYMVYAATIFYHRNTPTLTILYPHDTDATEKYNMC